MNLAFPESNKLFFFYKSFAVIISTCTALTFEWWNTNISGNTKIFYHYPQHLPLVWNPLPYIVWDSHAAWSPRSWHCTHCDWQASRSWSYTVRYNVVQWSLERTMALLVQSVCDSVRLLTADRGNGQAQARHCACTNTHIQTDKTDTHIQTWCAVGRIDAQKLQHCLHGRVVQ